MPHLFFFSNLIYRNLNNPSGGSVNSRENNEFDTINQFGSWMVDQLKTNFPGRLPPNGVYPFKVTLGNTSMDLWIPDGKDAEFTIRITYLSNKQRDVSENYFYFDRNGYFHKAEGYGYYEKNRDKAGNTHAVSIQPINENAFIRIVSKMLPIYINKYKGTY